MDRFHIVVSNYTHLESFIENFKKIHSFSHDKDKIYIFDCSPKHQWISQLKIADNLIDHGLSWEKNLFFIRRRNWNQNQGSQLDYFRSILNRIIPQPRYTAFLQHHYLDPVRFVKEDTIPDDANYDLNVIENEFLSNEKTGCIFFSRSGIKICCSNPLINEPPFSLYHHDEILPGAKIRCFCIDGSNFIVKPELYLNWFKINPKYLVKGDGSYAFSLVWEARLGKILYDQRIDWVDMYRKIRYNSIEQVEFFERKLGEKISKLWYDDSRIWYFFYGRDQEKYEPKPLISVFNYFIRQYLHHKIFHERNLALNFINPSDYLSEPVS